MALFVLLIPILMGLFALVMERLETLMLPPRPVREIPDRDRQAVHAVEHLV